MPPSKITHREGPHWGTRGVVWVICALLLLLLAVGIAMAGRNASRSNSEPEPDLSWRARKNPQVEIDPRLYSQLKTGGKHDFVIEFSRRPDLSAAYKMDWRTRGRYVLRQLQRAAERSQAETIADLRNRGVRFESFYVKNAIFVHDGELRTMKSLLASPDIARIRIPPKMKLILPDRLGRMQPNAKSETPKVHAKALGANVEWVRAHEVWHLGITGIGTVVGVIDSGVRYDHEALVRQYRGNRGGGNFDHNYSWFDPGQRTTFPAPASNLEPDQHGTHVTGTILGDDFDPDAAKRDRIGMAPGADWIACQGFSGAESVKATLLSCGQFMLAPTDLNGDNPDPDLRPMVVNNSWGACVGVELDGFYHEVIDSWNAAGIIPVFAAGNATNCSYPEPPGLSTVDIPGSYPDVFTVGSSGNSNGRYAKHSNWGPTPLVSSGLPNFPDHGGYPQLKPNVVAPGIEIHSATGTAVDTYEAVEWTGTSMSAPHVVGLMALMFEAAPCLIGDFATVGTLIQRTARPIAYASGGVPGVAGPGPGNVPNFATGWGEIDAVKAVNAALASCDAQAFIAGRVTAANSGEPIAGVLVEVFIDPQAHRYWTRTDADGHYLRRVRLLNLLAPYTVRVSRYGYLPGSDNHVTVMQDQTTIQDFVLEVARDFSISGTVTDRDTGWPLSARIDVAGYPHGPVWTDPLTGTYSLDLAEGLEYTFNVNASLAGYSVLSQNIGPLAAPTTAMFALQAEALHCNAPGYAVSNILLEENFEAGSPPTGWSETHLGTAPNAGWHFDEDLGSALFVIPAHTRYVAINDHGCGEDAAGCDGSADDLISPLMDLSTASLPVLRFDSFFTGDSGQTAAIEASIDGGLTWTEHIGSPRRTTLGWTKEYLNLDVLAGQANVRLRFHGDDQGEQASGWALDNILVVNGCNAPAAGGLVTGRVVDENTGKGLNGARVLIPGGNSGTTFAVGDVSLGDGFYALFTPPGATEIEATPGAAQPAGYGIDQAAIMVADGGSHRVDLQLPAGRIVVDPAAALGATVELGKVVNIGFTIANSGGRALNYTIVGEKLSADFEADLALSGWNSIDAGAPCPWRSNTDYGLSNHTGGQGRSAIISSLFCDTDAGVDTRLVSPEFDMSFATRASLEFMLSFRTIEGGHLYVDVSMDGGSQWSTLLTQSADASPLGPGTPRQVDLTGFLGSAHTRVRFRYVGEWDWWAQVDQVRLLSDANATSWLGIHPGAGYLAPGSAPNVHSVILRAAQVEQPGLYVTPLRLLHDTPYPSRPLDTIMVVKAPVSFGSLSGMVTGLGHCGATAVPLMGASVIIQGKNTVYQTITDETGRYVWQLDASQAPLTVMVFAPGYNDVSLSGIALDAGSETTIDIVLRSTSPCVEQGEIFTNGFEGL